MQRSLITAGAFAGLVAALAFSSQSASAVSLAHSPPTPDGIVQLAAPGGGHGGHGGGGHGGGGHGGGGHGGGHGGHGGGGHGGGWGHGPGGGWSGGHGRPHFHGGPRFRGYPYAYGFGAYPYYFYNDDFGDDYVDCAPLRRRALATGKRYWWNRYYACIED